MTEDALLRMEHKLDVIISYLHGMTDVPPQDIPKPLPGMGGETGGRCPITGTKIRYNFVPETGVLIRADGLLNGVPKSMPVPEPPAWLTRDAGDDVVEGGNDD
jgi:hypothetical protein